ncbi:MAG: dTMP kinase [Thermoplasmata archaeon]
MRQSRPGRRGLFVAIEGIDGAGKSTLQRALARRLRDAGWSVRLRREPVDPRLGRAAQRIAVEDPWSAGIWFTIDRARARPSVEADLRRADVVLTDRSYWSTLAYQGGALPVALRRRLARLQHRASPPTDLVLWLDVPADRGLARVRRRGTGRAPLERVPAQRRAVAAYRGFSRRPGWQRLDARRPPSELAARAKDRVERLLRRRARGRS